MRKNIFIKSMLRQPVRTAILVLLIAAAAFSFVMRATEYLIVTEQIEGIGKYYRAVGRLQSMNGSGSYENIYDAVEVLKESPQLNYTNEIRTLGARLVDSIGPDYNAFFNSQRFTETFFYGEILSLRYLPFYNPPNKDSIEVIVRVDEVLCGFPEHIKPGDEVILRYNLHDEELESALAEVHRLFDLYNMYEGETEFGNVKSALSDMEIGGRYFLRAELGGSQTESGMLLRLDDRLTFLGRDPNFNIMTYLGGASAAREPNDSTFWFLPAPLGMSIDLAEYGLDAELEKILYNQSEMTIFRMADMTALPSMQPKTTRYELVEGRWLTYEDNLNANHVVVIHRQFARIRGLAVGDTITYRIPQEQNLYGIAVPYTPSAILGIDIAGEREDDLVYEVELEIVGLFTLPGEESVDIDTKELFTNNTSVTNTVFVPDSALPDDIVYIANGDVFVDAGVSKTNPAVLKRYVSEGRFSFVLNDSRDEAAFLEQYRSAIERAGAEVLFVPSDAENYWASATPILSSTLLNTVIFSVVLVVVLMLVAFLYLRQRRREFAIQRALGVPAGRAFARLLASAIVFGLPSVALGSVVGRVVALRQSAKTMNPFGELATYFNFTLDLTLPTSYLAAMTAIVFALFLLFVLTGSAQLAAQPVLEMLSGSRSRRRGRRAKSHAKHTVAALQAGHAAPVPTVLRRRVAEGHLCRRSASRCALYRAPHRARADENCARRRCDCVLRARARIFAKIRCRHARGGRPSVRHHAR